MRLGIIGGTGLVELDLQEQATHDSFKLLRRDSIRVDTPYGDVPLLCCSILYNGNAHELVFLQRHHNADAPNRPPHAIDHRANITALVDAMVDAIVSVCSVGAIAATLPPGKVVLAEQYIDFSGRATTFHENEAVFTSVTTPFDEGLNSVLDTILRDIQGFGPDEVMRYTYWLAEGPQFETAAEVLAIQRLGGDMVGMTMPREAKLANERHVPYVAICISSNWAAGKDPRDANMPLNHHEVSSQANAKLAPVWACLLGLLGHHKPHVP